MQFYRVGAVWLTRQDEAARLGRETNQPVEDVKIGDTKAAVLDLLNARRVGPERGEFVPDRAPALPPPASEVVTIPALPAEAYDRAAIEAAWPDLPLPFRFHLCALTMEDARERIPN